MIFDVDKILMKIITFLMKIFVNKNFKLLMIFKKFKAIFDVKLYIISLNIFLIIENIKLFKNV